MQSTSVVTSGMGLQSRELGTLMGAFAWDAWGGEGVGGVWGSLAKPKKIIVLKIWDT